jgi:hypothetical protein
MSKQTPSSFNATASALHRLYRQSGIDGSYTSTPADSAAVIFAAIVQTRAIDRLTKAVERNTRAVLLAGKIAPGSARDMLDDPKWGNAS